MDIQGLNRLRFTPEQKPSLARNKKTLNFRAKLTKQLGTATTLFLIMKLGEKQQRPDIENRGEEVSLKRLVQEANSFEMFLIEYLQCEWLLKSRDLNI